MPTCRECGCRGLAGALFCTECGASLLELGGAPAVSDELPLPRPPQLLGQADGQLEGKTELILMVPASGRHFAFPLDQVILIGRKPEDDQSAPLPTLNLEHDGGQSQGVSRRHARIQLDEKGDALVIIDLYSTNGTLLNNFRLPPELPYPLRSGDEIHFGNLLVHIFIK